MGYLQTKHFIIAILSLWIATSATARVAFTIPQLISHPHLTLRALEQGAVPSFRIGMEVFGKFVTLKLRQNQDLLHSNYAFQQLDSANQIMSQSGLAVPCHFTGVVSCPGCHSSVVAVSTCGGELSGLISFNHTDYFIEPLVASDNDTHFIYTHSKDDTILTPSDVLFDKSDWLGDVAREQARHIRRNPRAYSIRNRRYYMEALVALDDTVVRHYGPRTENYVLSIMNIVAALLRRPSLVQSLTLVVARLVAVEAGVGGFQWNAANPDQSLGDFCEWQWRANGTQSHTTHDFAVLLTRRSLCRAGKTCYVIGIANVGGMCSGTHACLIVRDQGVMLSGTTVTHEVGHLFGMQHDENGICAPFHIPPSSHIMTQVFTASSNHFAWSECSRNSIADFLSRGGDRCLLNVPINQIQLPTDPLSADLQCRSILGAGSRAVPSQTTCATIACHFDTSTHYLRISVPLQDGTNCSINSHIPGRCQSGVCVRCGTLERPIHGQWSQWANWSHCSHSCDTSVRHRARECGAPAPSHGGDTCLGDRKQYEVCKVAECATSVPSRRTQECREVLAHQAGTWAALSDNYRVSDPCHLICRQQEGGLIAGGGQVTDGTECHGVAPEEALCVLGRCVRLDCAGEIGGAAREDACGVCRGDGATCHFVSEEFDDDISSHGLHRVLLIPPLARAISLLHLSPAHSLYLVVAQNGRNSLIRPGHRHAINGATWLSRLLSNGSVVLSTAGPLPVPTEIKVWGGPARVSLFLSYALPPTPEPRLSLPQAGHWLPLCSSCNATCGAATRLCHSVCVDTSGETVSEPLCDAHTKPANTSLRCENLPLCPTFFWAASAWGPCSAICGMGRKSRQTLCFARTQLAYRITADSHCGVRSKPATSLPCVKPCVTPRATSTHSHTSATNSPVESSMVVSGVWMTNSCDCSTQRLVAECRVEGVKVAESNCDTSSRPLEQSGSCATQCPEPMWHPGRWGRCDRKCRSRRVVECRRSGVTVPPRFCHKANKKRPHGYRRDCANCPSQP